MVVRKNANLRGEIMKAQQYTIDLLQPCTTVISEQNELQRVAGILNYPLVIRTNELTQVVNSPAELLSCLDI